MICPKCQAEVPENAPGGVCPKCLMEAALESQEELSAGSTPTSAQSGGFVPPQPESLSAHFPQLEVLELLGHGGMGAVYKARQKELDRLVAVKILPPEISSTPGFAQRFAREAKALAKLSHPNIVIVHDSGEREGLYYLIMEFVDGANLRTLMQSGELSPQQAMAIVPQVCDALQYAHDHGVVHRDIKPENILLSQSGAVKIADFGLAKLASHAPEEFTLTRTHQIMGTLKYMAPEQIEGTHEVDHRADIYSLGVVFYELLTGELPLGRFDPPSHKVQIDVRLDEVVLRALEKSPQRRYQQASEVKTAVESVGANYQDASPARNNLAAAAEAADETLLVEGRFLNRGPAIGYLVLGLLSLLTTVIGIAWVEIDLVGTGRPHLEELGIASFAMVAVYGLVCLLTGGAMFLLRFRMFALIVSAILAIPLPLIAWMRTVDSQIDFEFLYFHAYAATAGIPIALWACVALCQRSVRLAYQQNFRRRVQASQESSRSAEIRRIGHKARVGSEQGDPMITAPGASKRTSGKALSPETQSLRTPAILMILAAIVQILMALVITPLAALMMTEYSGGTSFPNILIANLPFYAAIGFWLMAALAASAVMIAGGTSMLRGNFAGWPVGGAAAEMLPVTPVWLFSFFLGIWSILALRKVSDKVRADAGNPITERERALRSIRPPGFAVMILGILNAVFGLMLVIAMIRETIAAFQGYQVWRLTGTVLFAVDVLVSIGIAVVGFRLTRLKSRRLGIVAAVLMIILPSPFIVFGIPVGIWTLCVLMQSHVRSACQNSFPPEETKEMKPSSIEHIRQDLRLPAIGLILAGLMNLVVFTLGTVGLAQLTLDIFGVTSGTLEEPGYESSPYDEMREEGPPAPWDIEPMDKHGKDGGEAFLSNSNITLAQYVPATGRVPVTLAQVSSESARPLFAPWAFIAVTLGLVLTILVVVASGLTMKAGFDLLHLKQTTWGDVASLSVLFIPPGCIIGIPCLIWSWVVRSRPEVREALAAVAANDW